MTVEDVGRACRKIGSWNGRSLTGAYRKARKKWLRDGDEVWQLVPFMHDDLGDLGPIRKHYGTYRTVAEAEEVLADRIVAEIENLIGYVGLGLDLPKVLA